MASRFADCEARDDWFWQQDVNAWSSFAYVAAGAVLLGAVARRRSGGPMAWLAVALLLAGAGSVLYHGSSGDLAQGLHDAGVLGLVGFVAGWQAGRLVGRPAPGALVGLAGGLVAGAAVPVTGPGATNLLVGALVALVAGSELWARRRGLPGLWGGGLVALAVVAGLAWAVGSASSPLCREEWLAQGHALWHVASALVVLAWADRAEAVQGPPQFGSSAARPAPEA